MNQTPLTIFVLVIVALSHATSAADPDTEVLEKFDKQLVAAAESGLESAGGPWQEIESIVFKLPPDSSDREPIEDKLIAALQSTDSPEFKRFLCDQLRVIGTNRCVPHVAKLLTDAQVSHMARRTLGSLESPDAADALLTALDETQGQLKAGVIDSLAERRTAAAFAPIVKGRNSPDPMVAIAAIRALGRFGGRDAHEALQTVTTHDNQAIINEVLNSLLHCAELYVKSNDKRSAASIYSELMTQSNSPQHMIAGLRGLLVHCNAATTLLTEAIVAPDSQGEAIALVREVQPENTELTQAIATLLPQVDEQHRPSLIRALGDRGDRSVARSILAQLNSTNESTQLAAIETLGSIGDVVSVVPLLKVAAADEMSGKVARAALAQLSGDGIDEAILAAAQDSDDELNVVSAIQVLGQRRARGSVNSLFEMISDSRESVRMAAIDGLGAVAGPAELDKLLGIATEFPVNSDRDRMFVSIGRVVSRIADEDAAVDSVSLAVDNASSADKPQVIALLSKVGSESAIVEAQGLVRSPNKLIRIAATEALANWPTADAIGDLETVMAENRSIEERRVALDGIIRLTGMKKDAAARLVKMIRRTDRLGEKKTVLAALGESPADSEEALDAALKYIGDARLQATAGLAALRIANRVRRNDKEKARTALNQVIATVRDDDVRGRAQKVLDAIDR